MTRIATADGYELHAEAHGEGTTVVLCCGLCNTVENWRPQVESFVRAGLRIALWDYRGHGRSDAPDDPAAYTIDHVVDDLARVVDWASPGVPAVVGGLSFGGLASLHFALRHPGRVRGLLLVDSGPGFKNPEAQARWQAMVERTASFVETRGLREFVDGRASETTVGQYPQRPAARAAGDAIAAQVPHGIAHFARRVAGPAPPVIDQLGEIAAPVLVIVGEKDEPYLRAAEVMENRLRNARRVCLAGAGHLANLDEPEAFDRIMIDFVQGLDRAGEAISDRG